MKPKDKKRVECVLREWVNVEGACSSELVCCLWASVPFDRAFGANRIQDHTGVQGSPVGNPGPFFLKRLFAKKITFQPTGPTFVAPPTFSPPVLPPSRLSQDRLCAARKTLRCEVGVVMALVHFGPTRDLVGFITPVGGRHWQRRGVYVRNVCMCVCVWLWFLYCMGFIAHYRGGWDLKMNRRARESRSWGVEVGRVRGAWS